MGSTTLVVSLSFIRFSPPPAPRWYGTKLIELAVSDVLDARTDQPIYSAEAMPTKQRVTKAPSKGGDKLSVSVASIVSSPLRSRIWIRLVESVASPIEMAREFDVPVDKIAYQVNVLARLGVIEKVRERKVRGATESFWRAQARPEITPEEAEAMSQEEGLSSATTIFQVSFADVAVALDAGTVVERPEHIVLRFPLSLDDEGWQAASAAYEDLKERLYDIEAESKIRSAKDPDVQAFPVAALGFLFEKPSSTA